MELQHQKIYTVLNNLRANNIYALNAISAEGINLSNPGFEVIKLDLYVLGDDALIS